MSGLVLVTLLTDHLPPRPEHLFPPGAITFTGAAMAVVKSGGPDFWAHSLWTHLTADCRCESTEHARALQEHRARIGRGEPVCTSYSPGSEPELRLILYTNQARTRTVVCSGLETPEAVLAEVEHIKPERWR